MSEHASLGASGASRWRNCPGSVAAEEGLPDESSPYAREGTAAHTVAADCLERGVPAFNSTQSVDVEGDVIVVSGEMTEAVQIYLDLCHERAKGAKKIWIEERLDLAPLNPPGPMFGTGDFGAWLGKRIEVVDLKYGKGVPVSAEQNDQGLFYALGFWVKLLMEDRAKGMRVEDVRVTIVQPRLTDDNGEPSITEFIVPVAELRTWAVGLLDDAAKTQDPNAPRRAGKWCKFCKAKPHCETFRDQALGGAAVAFSDIQAGTALEPVAPYLMDTLTLSRTLAAADTLDEWIASVRAHAFGLLEKGHVVEGWALKPRRPTRKWASKDRVYEWASAEGWPDETIHGKPKLLSPAQFEKLLKKGTKIPADLIVAESSGLTLCRDTDAKALVKSAADAFDPVP